MSDDSMSNREVLPVSAHQLETLEKVTRLALRNAGTFEHRRYRELTFKLGNGVLNEEVIMGESKGYQLSTGLEKHVDATYRDSDGDIAGVSIYLPLNSSDVIYSGSGKYRTQSHGEPYTEVLTSDINELLVSKVAEAGGLYPRVEQQRDFVAHHPV